MPAKAKAYQYKTHKGAHHRATSASFRRVAKELRAQAKLSKENCEAPVVGTILRRIAAAHDSEAKTLRSLR